MPGDIHERKSDFDNSIEITMEPSWAYSESGDSEIQLDPAWRSSMPKETCALTFWVMDTVIFSDRDPVKFNIDGNIISINSSEPMQYVYNPGMVHPYVAPWSKSGQKFMVSKSFLKKILNAKRVVIRIDSDHGYREATFSSPTQREQRAKQYLQRFYDRIFTSQS